MAALERPAKPSSDYDLNPDIKLPAGRKLRPAAVLFGIEAFGATPQVVLTKRASHLAHHPGQIAFPGGKQDETDASLDHTALREAHEEIGLPAAQVNVLSHLLPHETVTGYLITPILAEITTPFTAMPEANEVDEVFRVPLSFVMEPQNFRIEARRWQGQWRKFYAVPYGPYYIWGATARILKSLADRIT
ncbi:CoA pyrophosphatase [Roseovarius sp. 10]|nr:CoA pyrophosphatase [Roseovarius sp. 10]MDV7201888.1 CoA pyrophosphatase [Roseovarius sp. 10]